MSNDQTRGERRAESAKENDDSDIIDNADRAPSQGGRAGGDLQTDVATQAEDERVRDPEAREGVDKEDDITHGQRSDQPKPATHVVTQRD